MGDIQKYYKNTENALPHPMIKKFVNMNSNPKYAIDLGCGAGRDTVFLIKNGWDVISIDKENTQLLIEQNLNDEEKKHFKFLQSEFEDCKIEKNNLFVANFSIPFCKKEYFEQLWRNIVGSIRENRILYRKFFWI